MNESFLDNFFHFVSKIIIVVPITVVVVALFLKFYQPPRVATYLPTPTPAPTQASEIKPNLKGPFVCHNKEASISAYIKDKKIFVQNIVGSVVNNYLLNGDCFYIWKKGSYMGEKTCGGPANIINQIKNFIPVSSSQTELKALMNLCRKEEITDTNIFEIPKNIVFK